jgi:hypothetical protein
MKYAGEVSTFTARLPPAGAGTYTLRIVASSPKTVNFAMYDHELTVN